MNNIYVGKVVGTHGIKGEIKILSDFQFIDKVFFVGNKIIIDNKEYIIKSYRHHKKFEMITINDYNNINDVLFLINKKVYVNGVKLDNNEILDSDLKKYKVINSNGEIGKVLEIFMASPNNKIIRIMFKKQVLLPIKSPYLKIDKDKKEIYIELIEGM